MNKAGKVGLSLLLTGTALTCFLFPKKADPIKKYHKNFEALAKSEKWDEILSQGTAALEAAKKEGRRRDEAKICAQLTSTAFYKGNYGLALVYAKRCHELSEEFEDPTLFIRALYLESAVHRALAAKNNDDQDSYLQAVEIAEEAAHIYSKRGVKNMNLLGKVYFNLGAAHADNPKGNLEKAADSYHTALECFKAEQATNDVIRTSIRLGKVHLLRKNYDLCQKTIDDVRPQITNKRLGVHADYLEAQLKLAIKDLESARKIAKAGLIQAQELGAKADESRLKLLLETIDKLN